MRNAIVLAAAATLGLTGCDGGSGGDGVRPPRHGRYAGIGTYPAGSLWAQLAGVEAPKDPHAATIADDEQIIVVVDSVTGEVRQCGDLSGHCIAMNPWHGTSGPVVLGKHAADLAEEARAEEAAAAKGTPKRRP